MTKQQENIDEIEELDEEEEQEVVAKEEFDALKEVATQIEDKYKRALADYQNLEKRVSDQRLELIQGANRDLLLRLLPVLDTLILAQQHVADKNIEVSINHFLDVLKSEGVTRIKAVGEDFDPALMEAIAVGEGKEGKVLAEVRAGFLLHDKLLQAAQVTVGSAKQN